jgi:hypothetical protein
MKSSKKQTADVFKEGRKGYSSLSYDKVLDFLNIESSCLFSKDDDIQETSVNEKTLDLVTESLIRLTKAEGIVDEGDESKRRDFVSVVLYNIVSEYHIKK